VSSVFPFAAFLGAFAGARISLGHGLAWVAAVGYFSGVVRANFLSVFTTFMFDAALLGLYLGAVFFHRERIAPLFGRSLGQWWIALTLWPIFLALIPVNDYFVQAVALRSTVWFLPALLLGAAMNGRDLSVLRGSLATLNFLAFVVAVYIYKNGVEALYPESSITEIIYNSRDVGDGHRRIPSTFLSSHAYGATMFSSLIFLVTAFTRPRRWNLERAWLAIGVAAGVAGVVMCGARQPIVAAVLVLFGAWFAGGFSPRLGAIVFLLLASGALLVSADERFQRILSLEDTEEVKSRIYGSMNESFTELVLDYPLGAGMGTAVGTSIPYFLADRAPTPIGMENEYSRILVDQGWVGLLLWAGFLSWLHFPPPARPTPHKQAIAGLFYAATFVTWATASIGTGTLISIPGSILLLLQMGLVSRWRSRKAR
jgi:hypothetical protein